MEKPANFVNEVDYYYFFSCQYPSNNSIAYTTAVNQIIIKGKKTVTCDFKSHLL